MTRPNLGWRTAVVLATASLALSACGNSDSSDKKSSSGSSDTSSSVAKSGDGTLTIGTLYRQTARPVEPPASLLQRLPPAARRPVENAYATIEITDSVAQIAGHQVALVRGYSGRLQDATQALEADIMDPRPRYHEMTAVLDKVAAGELLARRQDNATNQLLSHALEQLLVRSKRLRDAEAATMNMRLLGMRDGRAAGSSLVSGAANDLRTWRQP